MSQDTRPPEEAKTVRSIVMRELMKGKTVSSDQLAKKFSTTKSHIEGIVEAEGLSQFVGKGIRTFDPILLVPGFYEKSIPDHMKKHQESENDRTP